MTGAEIVKTLEPWLAKHRRPAWKPIVADDQDDETGSKFGGIPWIGPDDPWPECMQCKQRLTLFLQLDLGNLPEALGDRFGAGLLQLFYCMRGECEGFGGWEPFADDLSRVRVVHPGTATPLAPSPGLPHFPARAIVGWTRYDDLPMPSEHDELGLKYTYNFQESLVRLACPDVTVPINECQAEEIALSTPGDKLAGWPMWIQVVVYPNCPRCGRRMIPIFQVDSEDNVPYMFGDSGCGHITQCPEHKDVVAFGWACC